jgi:hypothetical protein
VIPGADQSGLLELLSPLERRTLEEEIASYYSEIARQEEAAGRAPSDKQFATVRRRRALRLLHEVALGCASASAGVTAWIIFVSAFGG